MIGEDCTGTRFYMTLYQKQLQLPSILNLQGCLEQSTK